MLTPKYLEQLPQPMIQLYSRLENEIIEDVAKRISKANFLTPTAEWRLYKAEQLRLSSKAITAKLARLTGKSEKEIRKLYTAALKEALKNDEKIYRAAIDAGYLSEDKNGVLNSYFGSVAFSNALKAGLQNTNGLMRNLCNSAAASANRLLSDELDLAFMKVTSGAFTADEAVFSAVKRLGSSGLTVVNYASGRKDKIDVAVRRAVITGIGQAAANVQLGLASDMGCDLVEVTAHLGARPTHQVWQGRIFSLSGTHPKYPEFRSSTGYGTGDGLCGWNCRHSFYPYFEGLSKPVGVPFTKEENDKVYRDTQKQRAYERAVRQSKRELAALDASRSAVSDDALKQKLDREFQRKAVVLKRREAKLAEHLRASGLLPDNSRVRVDGFGRSVSGKAVWAAKNTNVIEHEKSAKLNNPTTINHDVIFSEQYRAKFNGIADTPEGDAIICQKARDMLTHRNNSYYEDMYLFNSSGKVVGTQTHSTIIQEVVYNKSLERAIKRYPPKSLISLHNHPESKPPSGSDLFSNGFRKYKTGLICCHNGDVYIYQTGKKAFTANLFDSTVDKYIKRGYNESEAYVKALNQFSIDYGIKWEVR